MATIPTNKADRYHKVVCEQALVRRSFPGLHARIRGQELTCRGRIQPTEHSAPYRVEIKYQPWSSPEIRVIEPALKFTSGAHMYRNDTLCLYDWREQPWQNKWHLHETVIPWVAEWLVFYELFLLTGKWLGPSANHTTEKTDEPKAAYSPGEN
ncbi:MAG: hypothetical protein ABMA26_00540 [Limisphaerales bacterium]